MRDEEHATLVDSIGDDTAEDGKDEERNGSGKADDAEPEGRIGEGEHEPALGYVLHPCADVGEEVAGPEEAEAGMAQGADHLRPALLSVGGEGLGGGRCLFDGEGLGFKRWGISFGAQNA
jgi:hypothetical protein